MLVLGLGVFVMNSYRAISATLLSSEGIMGSELPRPNPLFMASFAWENFIGMVFMVFLGVEGAQGGFVCFHGVFWIQVSLASS